jgi:hypothetical protein
VNTPAKKYKAHKRKQAISHAAARERSLKGWETRRRNNPHLRAIDYDGDKYTFHRRNGEDIELHKFSHDQVELMAPGLTAVDKHLKTTQNLDLRIKGRNMSKQLGGYAMPTSTFAPDEVPGLVKSIVKYTHGVDKDAWGNKNMILMNTWALDNPDPMFHPTGIMVHELGHTVGPGYATRMGPYYKGSKKNGPGSNKEQVRRIEKFEKAFDWEAPRVKQTKYGLMYDRKGYIDPEIVDNARTWEMKARHPGSIKAGVGERKGLSDERNWGTYAHHNPYEDFAEAFRTSVGMPMDIYDEYHKSAGKLDYDSIPDSMTRRRLEWMNPQDPGNTRRKYLLDEHLDTAAKHRQYSSDLAQITATNQKRATAAKARKVKARKQKVNKLKKGVMLNG